MCDEKNSRYETSMEEYHKNIRENIRKILRTKKDRNGNYIDQSILADRIGLARSNFSACMSETDSARGFNAGSYKGRNFTLNQLIKISNILGVSLDSLVGRSENFFRIDTVEDLVRTLWEIEEKLTGIMEEQPIQLGKISCTQTDDDHFYTTMTIDLEFLYTIMNNYLELREMLSGKRSAESIKDYALSDYKEIAAIPLPGASSDIRWQWISKAMDRFTDTFPDIIPKDMDFRDLKEHAKSLEKEHTINSEGDADNGRDNQAD